MFIMSYKHLYLRPEKYLKMKKIILTCFIIGSCTIHAQRLTNEKGNLHVLKDETAVNIRFSYDNMKLMKENLTEEQYVKERRKDLNEKNKGNGDVWVSKWQNAKDGIWEPKFVELLLKTVKTGVTFHEGHEEAKYTLLVDAVWIYPGWDVYMMKQPAKVTTKIKLIETANPSIVLYETDALEAPGDQFGSNFSNESRIGEGFAKTAKTFGKVINKALK